jgi:hypothetical protein
MSWTHYVHFCLSNCFPEDIKVSCQLVHFFVLFTKPDANPRRIGDRLVWAVRSNDVANWATRGPCNCYINQSINQSINQYSNCNLYDHVLHIVEKPVLWSKMYTFYICNTDYDWILFLVKLMLYRVARILVSHVL